MYNTADGMNSHDTLHISAATKNVAAAANTMSDVIQLRIHVNALGAVGDCFSPLAASVCELLLVPRAEIRLFI